MVAVPMWAAFGAGLLSLLSPCVLPLLPAYVGFLSGVGGQHAPQAAGAEQEEAERRARLVRHALLFVIGFSVVFIALGASASAVGRLLLRHQAVVQKIAGLIVIGFGLQTLGVLRIPFLDRAFQWNVARGGKAGGRGWWQALMVGMAFAGGWAPCVGPILGSILMLAATGETLAYGVFLLAAYSAGMGLPFLLFALFLGRMERVLAFFRRHYRAVQLGSGALLVAIGVMLYTNVFARLAQYGMYFYRVFEVW